MTDHARTGVRRRFPCKISMARKILLHGAQGATTIGWTRRPRGVPSSIETRPRARGSGPGTTVPGPSFEQAAFRHRLSCPCSTNASWLSLSCSSPLLATAFAVTRLRTDPIKGFVPSPPPLTESDRLFDMGVVDANGDDRLDVYTSNHHFRQVLLLADGKGGYRDVLSEWGLDQSREFPEAELSFVAPELVDAGVYVYWFGSNVVIRTHRSKELPQWQGVLRLYDPVKVVKNDGFAIKHQTRRKAAEYQDRVRPAGRCRRLAGPDAGRSGPSPRLHAERRDRAETDLRRAKEGFAPGDLVRARDAGPARLRVGRHQRRRQARRVHHARRPRRDAQGVAGGRRARHQGRIAGQPARREVRRHHRIVRDREKGLLGPARALGGFRRRRPARSLRQLLRPRERSRRLSEAVVSTGRDAPLPRRGRRGRPRRPATADRQLRLGRSRQQGRARPGDVPGRRVLRLSQPWRPLRQGGDPAALAQRRREDRDRPRATSGSSTARSPSPTSTWTDTRMCFPRRSAATRCS